MNIGTAENDTYFYLHGLAESLPTAMALMEDHVLTAQASKKILKELVKDQIKQHAAVNFWTRADYESGSYAYTPKDAVSYDGCSKSSFDTFVDGHEYLPIFQGTLNDNPNLVGNSANNSTSNASYFSSKGWTVHPVVDL